ncbi:MAG: hypothetical protein EPN22_09695 [Nitrospirae bacterium]|nr:MAG: hypothetical protein EPN22_09695 [Nitrospirota bacterium]
MNRVFMLHRALSVLFVLIFAASAFAAERQKPKQKLMDNYIAVFDVETIDVDKKLSRPLTESIRRELVMSGKYDVVDRGNMNKILGEQKFQMSGCVSGQCIVEAGQLLGAGKIISGSVSMIGKTYYLTLSLISVETGKIENVSEDECKCAVDDLLKSSKRLVKKLLGESVPEQQTTGTATTPSAPFSKGEYKDPTTGMEFVSVKGGCYQMGDTFGDGDSDEKPVHEVCVDDFYMGKYEVTNAQYRQFKPSHDSKSYEGVSLNGDSQPVVEVSWNDAKEYAEWLSSRTGQRYRLPTEAEWEYAARGGSSSRNYWGSSKDEACRYANVADRTAKRKWSSWTTHECEDGYEGTAPVGRFQPNSFGLYDMMGNVWEWTSDWYGKDYYSSSPRNNPTGPSSGEYRVLRGGSWIGIPQIVRAALRSWGTPTLRIDNGGGFHLVAPAR